MAGAACAPSTRAALLTLSFEGCARRTAGPLHVERAVRGASSQVTSKSEVVSDLTTRYMCTPGVLGRLDLSADIVSLLAMRSAASAWSDRTSAMGAAWMGRTFYVNRGGPRYDIHTCTIYIHVGIISTFSISNSYCCQQPAQRGDHLSRIHVCSLWSLSAVQSAVRPGKRRDRCAISDSTV